jgi:hypothetical protein
MTQHIERGAHHVNVLTEPLEETKLELITRKDGKKMNRVTNPATEEEVRNLMFFISSKI